MNRYKYTIFIFLAFSSFIGISQVSDQKIGQPYEPVYSQYWVNGLAINPAYTGSRECFSNTLLYRDQWTGFEGAPFTATLSSHAPFKDEKNAVGLFLFYDKIGVVTTNIDIYGNYAFRFKLGKGKLSLGLRAGATLFQGNYAKLKADPEDSPDPYLYNESATLPNAGVGVYYYTDKFFVGLSVPKLLSYEMTGTVKRMSISPDNYDFLLTAGYLVKINEIVKVKPSFLFRYRLDNIFQLDVGVNVILYDALWIGGSYRIDDELAVMTDDELAVMLEYQVSNQIRAGVAYDFTFGDLAGQLDALEIVLRYEFKYKIRAVSPRYF